MNFETLAPPAPALGIGLNYLTEREKLYDWGLGHRKVSRAFDEKLRDPPESQRHYLNLSSVEGRLDALLCSSGLVAHSSRDAVSQASSLTASSMPELQPMAESPTPRVNNTTVASDPISSCYTNSYSCSVLVDGLSASEAYLPKGHRHVLANISHVSSGSVPHMSDNLTDNITQQMSISSHFSSVDGVKVSSSPCAGAICNGFTNSKSDGDACLMPSFLASAPQVLSSFSEQLGSRADYNLTSYVDSNKATDCVDSAKLTPFSCPEPSTLPRTEPVAPGKFYEMGTQSNTSDQRHYFQGRQLNRDVHLPCVGPHIAFNQPHHTSTLQNDPHLQQQVFAKKNSLITHLPSIHNALGACHSKAMMSSQRGWEHKMLFLYDHAVNCCHQKGECAVDNCIFMKMFVDHISCCNTNLCNLCSRPPQKFVRLVHHFRNCGRNNCGTCFLIRERKEKASKEMSNVAASELVSHVYDKVEDKQPLLKRIKIHNTTSDYCYQDENSQLPVPTLNEINPSCKGVKSEFRETDINPAGSSFLGKSTMTCSEIKVGSDLATPIDKDLEFVKSTEIAPQNVQDIQNETGEIKMNEESKVNSTPAVSGLVTQTNHGKPRIKGASLLETFTSDKLRGHIKSLEQFVAQSKVVEQPQAMEHAANQNTCSLCGMEKLLFEPPPRYCASCSKQISPKGVYYVNTSDGSDSFSLCSKCYNIAGEAVKFASGRIPKANFEKRWNYAETDAESEWWVQCDKCEAWQHQICALFNGKRKEAKAEYTCANCLLKEIESGERLPLETCVLRAQDLPRTMLSDHIEQWLFSRLNQDRQERASALGKTVEEVLGVEGLAVRVVSSVNRVLKVKPYFHEFLKQEKYPVEFPYKSKAILLFQTIEGADVCLFAMYVQEYGSDCPLPNQRHIYLAYIDSVKYFRPEIKAASGEALRTFVYHEIMIGYLDSCKKRGFTSCSIWACPSTKHDDYILYCHPTAQKMPKSDKLRDWYQVMLEKAVKENVIAERTNLYDFFLLPANECKANVSAACLPYCENDFWPGEAERLLEKKDESVTRKESNTATQRVLRAANRGARIGNPDDILLLHKLGERMRSTKEDFILVYLQPICKHCRQPIMSGRRWVCSSCKNFQLCEQCHSKEENLPRTDKHPMASKEKHCLKRVEENPLPETYDADPRMHSEFFDSRTEFLSLCQGKQYQFDTLRRAKHSTMMILYHLHTPACSACSCEIDTSQSWHCLTCLDHNLCDTCYQREGAALHGHRFEDQKVRAQSRPSGEKAELVYDIVKPNKEINEESLNIQVLLRVLVHAPTCSAPCTSDNCRKLKILFCHGMRCKLRQRGGCKHCCGMWYMLQLHASTCRNLQCHVPRCKDLKDHFWRFQHHDYGRKRRMKQQ